MRTIRRLGNKCFLKGWTSVWATRMSGTFLYFNWLRGNSSTWSLKHHSCKNHHWNSELWYILEWTVFCTNNVAKAIHLSEATALAACDTHKSCGGWSATITHSECCQHNAPKLNSYLLWHAGRLYWTGSTMINFLKNNLPALNRTEMNYSVFYLFLRGTFLLQKV